MSDPPFDLILVGSEGVGTNPGVVLGNHTPPASGWSNLFTAGTTPVSGAAGVDPTVFGISNQTTSGAASMETVFSIDESGNVGIAGALSIRGAPLGAPPVGTPQYPSIGVSASVPSAPAIGSLYLRSDSALGPRFFQYQYLGDGTENAWLPVAVGVGLFNVKDFGAVGDGVVDDSAAQQATVDYAIGTTSDNKGGVIYYPPGTYLTASSCVLVSNVPAGLVFAGAGAASVIQTTVDQDILVVSGGANGLTIQDLQFQGPGTVGGVVPTSGAAIRFLGGGGQFRILNVSSSGTAFGVNAVSKGGSAQIIGCSINGEYVGVYITAGAEVHHSSIAGGTYGLILDGSNGMKLFDVDVYGALPLAMWNTPLTSGQNSFYGFDVEANFVQPPSGAAGPLWPTEGIGSAYLVPTGGQLHLVDCAFPEGTLIGGDFEDTTWVPEDITINGGSFANSTIFSIASGVIDVPSPFTRHAIEMVQGNNVTIGGSLFSSPRPSGFGLQIGSDVSFVSVVGNNFTGFSSSAGGAINIAASGGVNCQDNLIQPGLPSGGIFWPETTSQPFIVANNPGYNPAGFSTPAASGPVGTPFTLRNDYGVPGTFFISGGSGVAVSVFDIYTAAYNATGLGDGAFHVLPGGALEVTSDTAPDWVFIGD